jgi:hypothetical protein
LDSGKKKTGQNNPNCPYSKKRFAPWLKVGGDFTFENWTKWQITESTSPAGRCFLSKF